MTFPEVLITPRPIAHWTLREKAEGVIDLTWPKLGPELQNQLRGMLTTDNLVLMVALMGLFGFLAGAASGGLVFALGLTLAFAPALDAFLAFVATLLTAVDRNDLVEASEHLAEALVAGGIGLVLMLIGWARAKSGGQKTAPEPREIPPEPGRVGPAPGETTSNARAMVEKLRSQGKKVTVNIGGAGAPHEPPEAINLNPQVPGTERRGIPNHVNAKGEAIGELFEPGTVERIEGHHLPPDVLNWNEIAPGAYRVLRPGGTLEIYFRGANTDAARLANALRNAGFKNVQVVSDVLVTAEKP